MNESSHSNSLLILIPLIFTPPQIFPYQQSIKKPTIQILIKNETHHSISSSPHPKTMEKKTLFLLCFLLLFIQSSFARISPSSLKSKSPSTAAEKLIRQLNLLPKDAVPVIEKNINSSFFSLVSEEKIVEKSFRFPDIHEEEETGGNNNGSSSVDDLGHHAGYYKIQHSYAARMFYFFFESRNNKKNDPVVIWLTGGPGCSSELALFYENGPFTISDNLSLRWNNYGWDQASNLIYVDQPTGTGFSYSSDRRDLRQNEDGVSNDLYDFLQAFFAKHPEYVNNDFYITGESYAGHYIPAFASRVQKGNKAKEGIHINLKGIAIGNGLTNPAIQYKAYTDFALSRKIIEQSDYETINEMVPDCESATALCATNGGEDCITAYSSCTAIFGRIMDIAGNLNYYDIRKQCEGSLCYDFSNAENFLNERSVRSALGVGNIDFVSCSPAVHEAMEEDWMKNLEVGIPALLEDGIKVLIYAGEYDLICNWLGNWRWVHAMEWSGKQEFAGARNVSFNVDSKEAGLLKSHGSLSFLKVHDAGHMVPMDQPKASLEMLRRFTQGKLSEPASTTTSTSWKQHMLTTIQ